MNKKNLIVISTVVGVILIVLLIFLLIPKKYTITFDTNGGNKIEEVKVEQGTIIEDLTIPTKEGYTFLYWTFNEKRCNEKDEITQNMHLTAVWEKEESKTDDDENVKTYKVSFNSDGGSAIKEQKVEDGKKATEPAEPTKEGYTFVGWILNGKEFDFDTEITKDITLKAKWEKVEEVKTYTVTFNTDGGSSVSSQKIEEGKVAKKPTNPTKSGYTFVSWTLNGKSYNFSSKVTSNITLKATWKKVDEPVVEQPKTYTVTFDSEGGSVVASQTITEGNKVAQPSNPIRSGYVFKGWLLNGTAYDFNQTVSSNITLTASWEEVPKTYTIKVSLVDSFSPDRYLTVYENGTAIAVSKLMYTDGVQISATINGTQISVASADLVGETTFKVQLTNGKIVSATIQ